MANTSGFYKLDTDDLLFEEKRVTNAAYTLRRADQATYTYPIDGWYWFATERDARKALVETFAANKKVKITLTRKETKELIRLLKDEAALESLRDELVNLLSGANG